MADSALKPIVAVSGKMSVGEDGLAKPSQSVLTMKAMLEAQGAEVHILHPASDPTDVVKYDGLVLMGNDNDIDPSRYGQVKHHETKVETQRQKGQSEGDHMLAVLRSQFEYKLIENADAQHIPFFGICGGHQRYNVARGGSLIQHIEGEYQSEGPSIPVESVEFVDGTMLSQLAGSDRRMWKPVGMGEKGRAYNDTEINSFHHQAIDKLGQGLRVSGMSNGVIEAIESTNPEHYAVGVQWHPEFMPDSPLTSKLIGSFVEAAQQRAAAREVQQPQPVVMPESQSRSIQGRQSSGLAA